MSADHSRGDGIPSSLASPHHVGPDSKVVYSPAQLSALDAARAMLARIDADAETVGAGPDPAFLSHGLAEMAPAAEPEPAPQPADDMGAIDVQPVEDETPIASE